MITSMRRCVACDDLWPWPISSRSFDLDFENRVRSIMFSVLDWLFFWLGIQYDPIVWVIMRRRGVSSESRRSSCSSCCSIHRCSHTYHLISKPYYISTMCFVNMHMVFLYFVFLWLYLPIFLQVASWLPLEQCNYTIAYVPVKWSLGYE